MDWVQIGAAVLGSGVITGLATTLLAHRLSTRKQDAQTDASFREELRVMLREERTQNHECDAKVEKLQEQMTVYRIDAAKAQTKAEVLEVQMTEIRSVILREYVKNQPSLPAPAPAE